MRAISSGASTGKVCARRAWSVGDTGSAIATAAPAVTFSADVLLDDFRRPGVRLGRISAGFAQRAPLTQQVPALIELDLHVRQAFAAFRCKRLLPEKPVLFGHQALDMGEHGLVLVMFFHGSPRWMQKGVDAVPT